MFLCLDWQHGVVFESPELPKIKTISMLRTDPECEAIWSDSISEVDGFETAEKNGLSGTWRELTFVPKTPGGCVGATTEYQIPSSSKWCRFEL